MTARHCSQIARQENSLGRHSSRFRPILGIAHKQYQSLAPAPKTAKIVHVAANRLTSANGGAFS
jgi:hypothetical protein